MKTAKIIPLFKNDNRMMFNNCRPVSLLCVLSKVFENVTNKRLLELLNEFKLLYENQFGFRYEHSAYMALMILMDKILKLLENGEEVIGIFFRFFKGL